MNVLTSVQLTIQEELSARLWSSFSVQFYTLLVALLTFNKLRNFLANSFWTFSHLPLSFWNFNYRFSFMKSSYLGFLNPPSSTSSIQGEHQLPFESLIPELRHKTCLQELAEAIAEFTSFISHLSRTYFSVLLDVQCLKIIFPYILSIFRCFWQR